MMYVSAILLTTSIVYFALGVSHPGAAIDLTFGYLGVTALLLIIHYLSEKRHGRTPH